MNPKHSYETLSEAADDLKTRGYNYDFHFEDSCLICGVLGKQFNPEDLKITHVYRFEGMSDPEDNSVLYAIESKQGHKGLLIDAYGAYSDEHKAAFLSNIAVEED